MGGLGLACRRGPLGERLVEPQVVPPLHRDEVAEPHVRQLVQDRQRPALDDRLGDLGPEDIHLVVRHGSGVLHRAHVVFGGEDLVVLREGVRVVELVLEERESALRDVEDVVRVQVRGQRLAAEDAQWHGALTGLNLVADHVIRAGDQRRDVAGDARCRGKRPGRAGHLWALADDDGLWCRHGDGLRRRLVGHDLPVRRGGDREREGGLEIGLLKDGEHASAVSDLELRVQVDLVIDRVDEAVQSLAGVHVDAGRIDRQLVGARPQHRELDANPVEVPCRIQRLPVEGDLLNGLCDQVDEGARAVFGRGELDGGSGPEAGGPGRQVQRDVVRSHRQQGSALPGFVAGQVLAGHGVNSLWGSMVWALHGSHALSHYLATSSSHDPDAPSSVKGPARRLTGWAQHRIS